jgi:DNA replication protein DnaC
METNLLLDSHLKALRLSTFLRNYPKFAEEAAQANHSYDRFLLALAEQEVAQRKRNGIARRIKQARFPVLKELADFDSPALRAAQVSLASPAPTSSACSN